MKEKMRKSFNSISNEIKNNTNPFLCGVFVCLGVYCFDLRLARGLKLLRLVHAQVVNDIWAMHNVQARLV